MGRMRFADVRSSSGGRYRRLDNEGEFVRVMFVLDESADDWGAVFYRVHYHGKGTPPDRCRKDWDEDCPHCEAGQKVSVRMAITVFDVDSGDRCILDGFPGMWFGDLKDVINDPDAPRDWRKAVFKVTRKGQGSQTRRTITYLDQAPDEIQAVVASLKPFSEEELMPRRREESTGTEPAEYRDEDFPADDAPC